MSTSRTLRTSQKPSPPSPSARLQPRPPSRSSPNQLAALVAEDAERHGKLIGAWNDKLSREVMTIRFEGAPLVGPGDQGQRAAVYERMPGDPTWSLRIGPEACPPRFPTSSAPGSLALRGSLSGAHEVGRSVSLEDLDRATRVYADMRSIVYVRQRKQRAEWKRQA